MLFEFKIEFNRFKINFEMFIGIALFGVSIMIRTIFSKGPANNIYIIRSLELHRTNFSINEV